MENIAKIRRMISSVQQKLHEEIQLLQETLSGIDYQSGDPAEQWAHGLYTRMIERRSRMLKGLTADEIS